MNKFNFGVMQGRLVPPEIKNKIQSFPWKNWKKEFLLANKLKLKLIEWTLDNKNFYKNPLLSSKYFEEIKWLSKKNKINIESVTCDFFMEKPYFKQKQVDQIEIKKKIFFLINSCLILNIKYIVLPLVDNTSLKTRKDENSIIDLVNFFLPLIKLTNIRILFESDYNPNEILRFIKRFKTSKVGINYDTGNSASKNYDFNKEKIYFKYVQNIHIKDRLIFGTTVPLGTGNQDFKKIFKFLKKKYKGNLILQTARSKNKHVEELRKNFFFIKKIIKNV